MESSSQLDTCPCVGTGKKISNPMMRQCIKKMNIFRRMCFVLGIRLKFQLEIVLRHLTITTI
jgi:hypothetical protein